MISAFARGIDSTKKKIRFVASLVKRESMDHLSSQAMEFVAEAKIYPPESEANRPPPPFYTRTNTLKDGWKVNRAQDHVTISNATPYLPWVHGTTKQAWFHKARGWKTISDFLRSLGIKGAENDNIVLVNSKTNRFVSRLQTKIKNLLS